MGDDAAHLAVPIWSGGPSESQLQGAAKSVVRHLDPDDYESADGLHTEAASGAAR